MTDPAPVAEPVNRTPPALTGAPRLGGTLECGDGTWNGTYTITHRWLRDGTPIAGATLATYTVVAADVGQPLRCEAVVGTVAAQSQSVTPTPPASVSAPEISGDPRLRRTLRCSPGTWDGTYALTYQWFREARIRSRPATNSCSAPPTSARSITCRVTAAALTTAPSGAVTVRAPRNLVAPSVNGDPRIGATLSCDPGGWDDLPEDRYALSYRWLREGQAVGSRADPRGRRRRRRARADAARRAPRARPRSSPPA